MLLIRDDIDAAKLIIEMFIENTPWKCPDVITKLFETAIEHNFSVTFEWLIKEYAKDILPAHINKCVKHERYDFLIRLLSIKPEFYTPKSFEFFAPVTCLLLIELDKHGYDIFNEGVISHLIQERNFECLTFVHMFAKTKNKRAGCTSRTFDAAAACCNIGFVKYLNDECECGVTFTSKAYDNIVRNGGPGNEPWLEYIYALGIKPTEDNLVNAINQTGSPYARWIYEKNPIISTSDLGSNTVMVAAVMVAAVSNDMEMVKYLHASQKNGINKFNQCNKYVWWAIAENNYTVMADWLRDNCKCVYTRTPELNSSYAHLALSEGNLGIFAWFVKNFILTYDEITIDEASKFGQNNLALIKYLSRYHGIKTTICAADLAAGTGSIDIVKFLITHRNEGCTHVAIDVACRGDNDRFDGRGYIDIVKYLLETTSVGFTYRAIHYAAINGLYDILVLLTQPENLARMVEYKKFGGKKQICRPSTPRITLQRGHLREFLYLTEVLGVPHSENYFYIVGDCRPNPTTNFDWVSYVYDNFPEATWDDSLFKVIICFKNLELLKLFYSRINDGRYTGVLPRGDVTNKPCEGIYEARLDPRGGYDGLLQYEIYHPRGHVIQIGLNDQDEPVIQDNPVDPTNPREPTNSPMSLNPNISAISYTMVDNLSYNRSELADWYRIFEYIYIHTNIPINVKYAVTNIDNPYIIRLILTKLHEIKNAQEREDIINIVRKKAPFELTLLRPDGENYNQI